MFVYNFAVVNAMSLQAKKLPKSACCQFLMSKTYKLMSLPQTQLDLPARVLWSRGQKAICHIFLDRNCTSKRRSDEVYNSTAASLPAILRTSACHPETFTLPSGAITAILTQRNTRNRATVLLPGTARETPIHMGSKPPSPSAGPLACSVLCRLSSS